jgi:predicted DNA-binding transcriptional regulator AlpA
MANDPFDPILSDAEYRAWVGISAPTAQRQRSDGSGPPFIQLSERRIGYRKSAVERWLEARTVIRVGELDASRQAPARSRRNGCGTERRIKRIGELAGTVSSRVSADQ